MTYIIDIDGTICEEGPVFERSLAKPLRGAVEKVNWIYNTGNIVIFFTARGWQEYKMTEFWLKEHGFLYHQLICGKPIGDKYVDDRSTNSLNNVKS
jgi:hypothetical protein